MCARASAQDDWAYVCVWEMKTKWKPIIHMHECERMARWKMRRNLNIMIKEKKSLYFASLHRKWRNIFAVQLPFSSAAYQLFSTYSLNKRRICVQFCPFSVFFFSPQLVCFCFVFRVCGWDSGYSRIHTHSLHFIMVFKGIVFYVYRLNCMYTISSSEFVSSNEHGKQKHAILLYFGSSV